MVNGAANWLLIKIVSLKKKPFSVLYGVWILKWKKIGLRCIIIITFSTTVIFLKAFFYSYVFL